jgi:3',5'-cyclic AMP phosphodiesterase CpdA
MAMHTDRRDFLKLSGLAGVAFASGLFTTARAQGAPEFHFVQLSDTHWGFKGAPNPDAEHTLEKAVATVNALAAPPDFIVFTGDLTHTTDDPKERRTRLKRFKEIVSELHVKDVRFMPGEHDASLDHGEAYKEFFGATHYTFDHKGVHFIVLDNVSDPTAAIGEEQLSWLAADLKQRKADDRIVVFTHRPLFDLYPQWDWATRDGAKAVDLLMPFQNVVVFYGHIHQEHHQMTGHIAHHAARSLIFPQPAPGSQPKRAPVAWDPDHPNRGLGERDVTVGATYTLTEMPVTRG